MARRQNHGNGQLEESLKAMQQALTQMLQAQANMEQNLTAQSQIQTAFLARMAETDKEIAQFRRESDAENAKIRRESEETNRRNAQLFARIEERFARIEAILAELPEAVHRQFGFQPPRPPTDQS